MRILLFLAVILSATLVLAQGGGVDYKGVAPIVVSGGKVGLSLSSTGGLSLTGTNLSLSTGGTAGQAVIYGQAGSGTIATSGSGTFGTLASSGTNFSTDSAGVIRAFQLRTSDAIRIGGLSAPASALDVTGNAAISGYLFLNTEMLLYGNQWDLQAGALNSEIAVNYNGKANGVLSIYDGSAHQKFQFNPNGNSYLNGGNVGIGTTSPGAKLDVNGVTYLHGGAVFLDTLLGYASANVQLGDSGNGVNFTTVSNKNITFNPNGTGNVGIGNTSPGSLLVVGSGGNFAVSSAGNLTLTGTASVGTLAGACTSQFSPSGALTAITATMPLVVSGGSAVSLSSSGSITTSGSGSFGGNVGIGSTSPGSLLTVGSGSGFTVDGTGYMVATSGSIGSLGIGRDISSYPLDVGGFIRAITTTSSVGLVLTSSSGQQRSITFTSGGAKRWVLSCTNSAETGASAGSDFSIQRCNDAGVASAASFAITRSTGVVSMGTASIDTLGIGTTSPTYNLTVTNQAAAGTNGGNALIVANVSNATGQFTVNNGTGTVNAFLPTFSGFQNDLNSREALKFQAIVPSGRDLANTQAALEFWAFQGSDVLGNNAATLAHMNAISFGTYLNSAFTQVMVIDKQGNVGIGTTAPSDKLIVMGGNVGFGTNTLGTGNNASTLTVQSNDATYQGVNTISSDVFHGAGFQLRINGVSSGLDRWITETRPSASFGNPTTNGWYLRSVDTLGNLVGVPIMVTSSQNILLAAGTSGTNGNVGIGNTSPGSLLVVGSGGNFAVSSAGNLTLTGTASIGSLGIGRSGSITTSGSMTLTGSGTCLYAQSGSIAYNLSSATMNTSGGTATVDWGISARQKLTLSATGTAYISMTPPPVGVSSCQLLITGGTGTNFPSTVTITPTPKWSGGTAYTPTQSASFIDIISLWWDGSTWYSVFNQAFQ